MADNPPRKQYDDWRNIALADRQTREAARRRVELSDALSRFIAGQGAWVTSVPGQKALRVEMRQGSSLPAKLVQLGYAPRLCSAGTRITADGFVAVDVLEISLG